MLYPLRVGFIIWFFVRIFAAMWFAFAHVWTHFFEFISLMMFVHFVSFKIKWKLWLWIFGSLNFRCIYNLHLQPILFALINVCVCVCVRKWAYLQFLLFFFFYFCIHSRPIWVDYFWWCSCSGSAILMYVRACVWSFRLFVSFLLHSR